MSQRISKLNRIILFCALAINCNCSYAQQDSAVVFNKSYFKSYWSDTKGIVTAPLYWNEKQWAAMQGVAATAIILYIQDLNIQQYSQLKRTHTSSEIVKYGLEPWGAGKYSAGIMGLFYLNGIIFKNERSKKTAMLGIKALIITAPYIFITKALFYRDRPYYHDPAEPNNWSGPGDWLNDIKNFNFNASFPSGHTTSAFAAATIIASEYRDKPVVPVIAYSLAALTGLSRIHDNDHWASDVFVGATFGYAMSKLIYNSNNWGVRVTPYKTGQETGMVVNIPFK